MEGFQILVTGASCAIAFYYLARQLRDSDPSFDRETVARFGIAPSAVVFALAGPVLLVTAWAHIRATSPRLSGCVLLPLAIFWTGVLGFAAVETGRFFL